MFNSMIEIRKIRKIRKNVTFATCRKVKILFFFFYLLNIVMISFRTKNKNYTTRRGGKRKIYIFLDFPILNRYDGKMDLINNAITINREILFLRKKKSHAIYLALIIIRTVKIYATKNPINANIRIFKVLD